MASGGEGSGPTNLDRGKGPLQNLLEHEGEDVNYNDRLYHEFLQSHFESDHEFDADEEEKPLKSDLFRVHMKKIELDDGTIKIMCNYCPKTYKAVKSFGYGTYWNHVKRNHPSELVKASNQGQISRAKKLRASSSSSNTHSELDRFLEANHDYEQEYPNLAIIAKPILGTPVSTVAVEQEFSAGGNILDLRRSVLCPQSLEAQACVDDWTKAKFRQQELEPEIVNDFFEDDQTMGTEGSE
ncbi:hypothetical protein Ddye_028832 [Dipteronia dyeriana]|uniref:HAT C-terminal dimerisation domain-containing protein n=1 Tax=Dipteronia dyeriana TaxID=168575 RepID=A0AAD9TDA1_9ROSI|nr:hypothetical protein Ddye_028832 [Dipteronia dyeriana]